MQFGLKEQVRPNASGNETIEFQNGVSEFKEETRKIKKFAEGRFKCSMENQQQ
jgi:hypothetical protein